MAVWVAWVVGGWVCRGAGRSWVGKSGYESKGSVDDLKRVREEAVN